MKFKAYTGITWSDLELTGVLEDEDSRVYYEKFKKHLALHPFHLTNLTAALNEILSSKINAYDTELKGFVLAYKNPKLLTPLGEIFYDTCFIHVDIEADFYVFRPEVGCSLRGIVNKTGLDHIGILVHKAFNVSIPKPDDEQDWPGDDLEIGQEVRFEITLLDFSSKLPFIRGVLKPDNYLQGCKLVEKTNDVHDRRKSNDNTRNTDDSTGNTLSVANDVHIKEHSFFSTDSENTSDEDTIVKKIKICQQKKPKNKLQEDELVECNEKQKESKKRAKKSKEFKSLLDPVEIVQNEFINNNSMNGEVNYELAESITSKKRAKRKNKGNSPATSISEDSYGMSESHSPKKVSKKLHAIKSEGEVSKVKVKKYVASSDSELAVEEEILPKLEVKSKKNSKKKKHLSDVNNFSDDFNTDKHIRDQNNAQEVNISDRTNQETLVNIKSDTLIDTYIENNEVEESFKKKKHKKRKLSIMSETSEYETDDKSHVKALLKNRKRKSSIVDFESTFQNVNVKSEKISSDFESTQEENYVKIKKKSKKNRELNVSTCSSNCDVEDTDENNKVEKKRKKRSKESIMQPIKIEPGFDDVVIKVEKSDDYDVEKSLPETYSSKRRHKIKVDNDVNYDEAELEENVRHIKKSKAIDKDANAYTVKVKTEKNITDENESDLENVEKHLKKSKVVDKDIKSRIMKVKTEKTTTDEDEVASSPLKNGTGNVSQTYSPSKKRTINLNYNTTNETNTTNDSENDTKDLEKLRTVDEDSRAYTVNVKTEKFISDDERDDNMVFTEPSVNTDSLSRIKTDTDEENNEKKKKHSNNSPNKQLNKSKKSELHYEFSKVEIKIEESDS